MKETKHNIIRSQARHSFLDYMPEHDQFNDFPLRLLSDKQLDEVGWNSTGRDNGE